MKKRMIRRIAALAAVVMTMIFGCSGAAAQEYFDEQYYASGADLLTDGLPKETETLLEDAEISVKGLSSGEGISLSQFVRAIGDSVAGGARQPLGACAVIAGVTVICAVLNSMKDTGGMFPLAEPVSTVAATAGVAAAITPVMEHITSCCEAVGGICDFTALFMPVFAAVSAADGSSAAAAGCSTFTLTAAECISVMLPRVVVPLLRILLAVGTVTAAAPCIRMDGVITAMNDNIKWVLGLLAAVFAGVLGVSVKTAAAVDSAGVKAARFVVSNAVPVIGGSIGDALASVQSCVGILRSSVGGFGIIAMGTILLPPMIRTALWIFGTGLCRILAQTVGCGSVEKLLGVLYDVLRILMAVMIFTAVVLTTAVAMLLAKG